MELVRRDSLKDMSVMASPMGHELYTWLGFERVGTFYIQVPGEDERLALQAMMYKPLETHSAPTSTKAGWGCVIF
jgi:hypothetical protein